MFSPVSQSLLAYPSFDVSHLFYDNIAKIKRYHVIQFNFISEFNAFAQVNEILSCDGMLRTR